MKVTVFLEGGGDTERQKTECRRGFQQLFAKAGFTRPKSPTLVACGGRQQAFNKFKAALAVHQNAYLILLVDSEDPVANADESPDADAAWRHLKKRDGWERPAHAANDQAQLMATCMETWVMADQQALRAFFGQHLQTSALLPPLNLETRGRHEVQDALQHATRNCGRDRGYAKGKRSFAVLAELNPGTLQQHLPHFRRFIATLTSHLS